MHTSALISTIIHINIPPSPPKKNYTYLQMYLRVNTSVNTRTY